MKFYEQTSFGLYFEGQTFGPLEINGTTNVYVRTNERKSSNLRLSKKSYRLDVG